MNSDERDIELIDAFLRDELTSKSQKEFDERMKDVDFKEKLEYLKDLLVASNSVERESRKSWLDLEENKITSELRPKKPKESPRKWLWGLAGMIVVIITIIIFNHLLNKRNDPKTLFAHHFEAYPNVINPVKMGPDRTGDDPYQLYEQELYADAIQIFSNESSPSDTVQFYLGLAHLFSGNESSALSIFNALQNDTSSRFSDAIEWYRAGIMIRMDNNDEAILILDAIAEDEGHSFNDQAIELLSKI